MGGRWYRALFLHPEDGADDFAVTLPVVGDTPPGLLRLATTFENARAIDVYRLVERSGWPEAAAFMYEETIPGTIQDGQRIEQVIYPDD